MPALTRNESRDIRNHLVATMLDTTTMSTYLLLLTYAGVHGLEDLLTMDELDIKNLVMVWQEADDCQTTSALNRGSKKLISLLVTWLNIKKTDLDMQNAEHWTSLTSDEFNEFRLSLGNATPVPAPPVNNIDN
jgi:hypothetical protein